MSIKLSEVLFPLRYDVWDQAPALKALMDEYGDDTPEMMEAGCNSAIYRHLVIADPVYQAMGALTPLAGAELTRRIERYYGARMTKLTGCYQSIKVGWDRSQDRIYYKRMQNPTVTTAANPVPDGLFLANGQHRTIALMALGYTELPDYIAGIQVKQGTDFLPLDLTWAYIKAGECTEQKFVEFARFRFPDIPREIVGIRPLSNWFQANGPAWVVEYIRLYWR